MKRMLFPILKKYWKLLISIILVSSLGCGIMTGLSGAYVSLDKSLNSYVENYNYPDAVITTDVTNRNKIESIEGISGIKTVNARLCGDTVLVDNNGRYLSVRVFSYNDDDKQKFHIWSKAESNGKDEVYLEYNFAVDNNISAGDTISFKIDNEYRDYFISAIVSMPETLSVQPTDDSWGVNTDFGYAYANVDLLRKEYEKKYSDTQGELNSKDAEIKDAEKKANDKIAESQKKLDEAKKQLEEKEKLFNDSSLEAKEKQTKLKSTKKELVSQKQELEKQKSLLTKTRKTVAESEPELKSQKSALIQARDSLKTIDTALDGISSQQDILKNENLVKFVNLMRAMPDETDLSKIFSASEVIRNFVELAESYGFNYDVSDTLEDFVNNLHIYMETVDSDYEYLNSQDVVSIVEKIKNIENIEKSNKNTDEVTDTDIENQNSDDNIRNTEEYLQLVKVIKRYSTSNIENNFENAYSDAVDNNATLHKIIDDGNLYENSNYILEFGTNRKVYELFNGVAQLDELISSIGNSADVSIKTAVELTKSYDKAVSTLNSKTSELETQRKKIVDTLKNNGLTEKDIESSIKTLDEGISQLKSKLSEIDSGIYQINSALPEIESGISEIDSALATIDSELALAEEQIKKAKEEIEENEKKLKQSKADSLKEFANLKDELQKAYQELEDGQGYDALCNQFLLYFDDGVNAETALKNAEKALEDTVIKSSFTYENSSVKNRIDINLEPIGTMSIFMPMIFFIIILIVVFLFMSLIIKQSRREIGILRALGFGTASIKALFCAVNLIVSIPAIVLGCSIGYALMRYVGGYYTNFFPLPEFTFNINIKMTVISVVLTLIVGQISTLIGTTAISKIQPSEAMSRPAPVTAQLPVFIAKITEKTSPMVKFSVTSLLRNKIRFAFSVICVSASVMMIFSSLAFITSKNFILHQLFEERINYDCQIFFSEQPSDEFINKLNSLDFVNDAQPLSYYEADVTFQDKNESAVINTLDKTSQLVGVFDSNDKKIEIPDNGIILEKHLASRIGATIGDIVEVNSVNLKVIDISDQCVSRFQYISPQQGEKLGEASLGSVICNIKETDEQKLLSYLSDESDIYLYTVFTRLSYQGNEKIFKTYDLAAWIIITFAIIIGLVIVLNTTQTNLLEKKKELCILRTLGFQRREISASWFSQSFLQFIFSCIIGLPTGIYIAKIALEKLSTEGREYVFANSAKEYVFTVLLVFVYIVVSHFIAMCSMKRWNMVESVKDKE